MNEIEATKKMISISNKLSKLGDELENIAFSTKPMPLSTLEIKKYLCLEARDMITNVCKHLTTNGTIK